MANIKLLADLQLLTMLDDPDIANVAARALEEIEYLEGKIEQYKSELAGED